MKIKILKKGVFFFFFFFLKKKKNVKKIIKNNLYLIDLKEREKLKKINY